MSGFKAIAIVRLSALGDIIHALPLANILKRKYPTARISWIVDTRYQDILEGYADIDEIIPINTQSWKKGIRGIQTMGRDIRNISMILKERRFSLALDLQGLIKSGIISAMTRAEKKVGFDRAHCREPLNVFFTDTHVTPRKEDVHIIDKNLALLRGLGINTKEWNWRIPVEAKHRKKIGTFLEASGMPASLPLVGINPGAGWETKRWGTDRFSHLADRLVEELGVTVVWTWGPGEKVMVDKIRQLMKKPSFAAPPTSVLELAALIRRLNLFICGDSGPLHLAVALGVPTVSIFGPTDPKRNGPYGPGHRILYHVLECSCCHKRTCNDFHCLDQIVPELALQACREQLERAVN